VKRFLVDMEPIIAISIILGIWVILVQKIIIPFTKPKLSANETFKYLEKNKCIYVSHNLMTKQELKKNYFNLTRGVFIMNFGFVSSEYKLIAFSESENKHKIFWVNLTEFFGFGFYRNLKYIEEYDLVLLRDLNQKNKSNIIIVKSKCPACSFKITDECEICKNCGLFIH
jgi:hypothetical protein